MGASRGASPSPTLYRQVVDFSCDHSFAADPFAITPQPSDNVVLNPIASDGTISITTDALTSKAFYEARMAASAAAAGSS